MKTTAGLLLLSALSAAIVSLLGGCSSDGTTPKCTPPDYSDCLEPATGGYAVVDSGTDAATD